MASHSLVQQTSLPDEVRTCINKATEVRERAYCLYSKFKVGAALITSNGQVFTGCNVENVSYGLTICAERTAIVKAVSEGQCNFKILAVSAESSSPGSAEKPNFVSPCGACRQFIGEFSSDHDIKVYLSTPSSNTVLVTSARQLLPLSFTKQDLDL